MPKTQQVDKLTVYCITIWQSRLLEIQKLCTRQDQPKFPKFIIDMCHIICPWTCDGVRAGPNFRLHFHLRKWKTPCYSRRKTFIFVLTQPFEICEARSPLGGGSFQCVDRLTDFMCNNLVLGGLPRVHENDYKIEAVQDQKFQSMLNFRRNFNNQNSHFKPNNKNLK